MAHKRKMRGCEYFHCKRGAEYISVERLGWTGQSSPPLPHPAYVDQSQSIDLAKPEIFLRTHSVRQAPGNKLVLTVCIRLIQTSGLLLGE